MKGAEYLKKIIQGDHKYRDLFENNRDGVYITTLDGTVVDVNNAIMKLTGYSRKEFFRKHSTEHYVNPADRIKFQNTIKKDGFVKDFLVALKTKSGKHLYCMLTSTGLRDDRNKIIGYHGIIHDVTEIKTKERIISENEKKFRDLFESSPDPIFVESLNGTVLDVNRAACRLHGVSRDKLTGRHFTALIPKGYRKLVKNNFDNFVSGKLNRLESYSIGKDNKIIPVELRVSNITYESKPAILIHVRDISERKKAEEKLKSSYEQLRQLAKHLQNAREEESSRIAKELHDELGQAVTVLKLELAFIGNKLSAGILNDDDICVLKEKTRSLMELVNGSIDSVRRISAHLHPVILDELGLIPAIEWYTGDFTKRTGIICTARLYSDGGAILNPDVSVAIFRIIQESLTNIIRHSSATAVRIFLNMKKTHLSVKISDNGKGFDINRLDEMRSNGITGMNERALSIGGVLIVSSKINKGTIISLSIPVP
ncbi:MAG: PAS domain S-box protein [Bacteroidetes bacterium]|nr:PAS domain S-box protein [Bacteroidota bacterium]